MASISAVDQAGVPDGALTPPIPPAVAGRLPNWKLFIFSLAGMPQAIFVIASGFFLMPFMTGEKGVSLTAFALVTLLAKLWDVTIDPMIGVACDLLPSRWGRRRHWIAIGVPILMAGIAMLCMPQVFTAHVSFLYLLGAFIMMQVGTTVFGLNSQAWGAELSEDYQERSRIMGWRFTLAGVGPLIAFGIGIVADRMIPHANSGEKMFLIASAALIAFPVVTLLAFIFVPEAPSRVRAKSRHERISFGKSWVLLIHNRNMARLLLIQIAFAMPFAVSTLLNVFFVTYVLKAPQMQSTLLLLTFLAAFGSMPLWVWASKFFEKHKLLTYAMAISAALTASLVFFGPGQWVGFAVVSSLLGITTFGPNFLLQSIVADVVDSDTLATGEQRTGTFFALTEMTTKLVPAIMVIGVLPFLQWMGFDPTGHHSTAAGVAALRYSAVIFPPVPMIIAGFLLYTFPLGKKEQMELREKIRETHG